MVLLELLLGCPGTPVGGESQGDSASATPPPHDLVLADEHNYTIEASLAIPSIDVAELSDVVFDWSDVTSDLQCHAVDPVADIDTISLMLFRNLTQEEIAAGLADGSLEQTELGAFLNGEPADATTWNLVDLGFFGTDVDIEDQTAAGVGSWLIAINTGDVVGVGARDLLFINPTASEPNTEARFTDGCGKLAIDPDLDALEPVPVAAEGPWTVDWSGLTQDGQDHALEFGDIDLAMLAWYPGYTTQALEEDFFDLELNAALTWNADLDGHEELDFSALLDSTGSTFPGFAAGEGDGLWLFALRCTLCPNPAPLLLTILQPG